MRRPLESTILFRCVLAFWLLVPFPIWLLIIGYNGQIVFLPGAWNGVGVSWTIAFYVPLALFILAAAETQRFRVAAK